MSRQEFVDNIIRACTKTKARDEANQDEKAAISIIITREELAKGHIQRHLNMIERAEKKKSRARHGLTLSFQGIDNKKMIEYKEVRTYLLRLFKIKPHLLYFLSQECNLQGVLLCLLEINTSPLGDEFSRYQKGRAEFTFYGADIEAHIRKHVERAVRYANGLKDSEAEQRALIEFILDAISYESLLEAADAI